MDAVGSAAKAGSVIAGCLLTAACAAGPQIVAVAPLAIPVSGATTFVRVPTSTLVTRRDLPFKLAQWQRGPLQSTTLVHQHSSGEPFAVAVISSARIDGKDHVSLRRVPLPVSLPDAEDLELAAWEHLYALTMRMDAEGRYCLSTRARECDAAKEGRSHAEVLQEIAAARQSIATRAHHAGVSWGIVSMSPASMEGRDPDQVGVRVTNDRGTLEGAMIYFNRAPHSGCAAKSGKDGIATCRLVDQHGDEDEHGDGHQAVVVATFPGDVRSDRVLPPTTEVLLRR